jgi:hypothetical protein
VFVALHIVADWAIDGVQARVSRVGGSGAKPGLSEATGEKKSLGVLNDIVSMKYESRSPSMTAR